MKSNTDLLLQTVVGASFAILLDCGITKPSIAITLGDKIEIDEVIALHHAIVRSKAELDQFAEGLDSCMY